MKITHGLPNSTHPHLENFCPSVCRDEILRWSVCAETKKEPGLTGMLRLPPSPAHLSSCSCLLVRLGFQISIQAACKHHPDDLGIRPKTFLAKGQGVLQCVRSQRSPVRRRSPHPRLQWSSGGPGWIAPVCWCSRPGRKAKHLLLHQLMWECDSSLAVNKSMYTVRITHTPHTHTRQKCWSGHEPSEAKPPPHLLQVSPPPCRCWMGGPVGRRACQGSYSSCRAPACLLLQSECKGSRTSRTSRCCRNTWTEQERRVLGDHLTSMNPALGSERACVTVQTHTSCCSLSTALVTWS